MSKRYGQLPRGKEVRVLNIDSTVAGVSTEEIGIDSDSVLVSVFCDSTAGDLDVLVETTTDVGQDVPIIVFPTISGPTTNLVIKKAALSMDRIRITATYTGACKFSVRVRGIGNGETTAITQGQANASAEQHDVGTTTTELVSAVLYDRAGFVIKNFSAYSILYIGFTAAEAVVGTGWPLVPGEALACDVAAGQSIFAVSDTGIVDARVLIAGNP